MTFTIVIDNDLHFSVLELAAILDLELKTEENHYKTLFQNLLDENKTEELTKQLIDVQPLFIRNFSKKSFEPTINLYLHITKFFDNDNSLLSSLLLNIDPNSSKNTDISSKIEIPLDAILIALTNFFNSLPNTSSLRFESLSAIVNLIIKENLSGVISNIARNIEAWILSIENIPEDQIDQLILSVFNKYSAEDETNAIKFVESLVINSKLSLKSETLIAYFSTILSSSSIYDFSKVQSCFKLINDESFVKLLNYYLIGDFKSFISNKSEFQSGKFSSLINFTNLESTFESIAILNYLTSSKSASIPYNNISNDLTIPIENVELKLITLISQGLIVAKLSQSTNSVIVNSINYSSPTLSSNPELVNWSEINTLLGSWNENINNLQSIVQTLIAKRGKRVNAPPVIMAFHQQKLEAKEAREKKAQQDLVDQTVSDATPVDA
jgi:hypothetical protein